MIVMGDMNAIVRDDGSIWGDVRDSHEEQVSLKMGGGCSAVTTISLFQHLVPTQENSQVHLGIKVLLKVRWKEKEDEGK